MSRKNQDSQEGPSVAPRMNTGTTEQSDSKETRYVVVRDGHRVSAQEYSTSDDPKALEEKSFWTKVSNNHSWGELVNIVRYDNKIHRVW